MRGLRSLSGMLLLALSALACSGDDDGDPSGSQSGTSGGGQAGQAGHAFDNVDDAGLLDELPDGAVLDPDCERTVSLEAVVIGDPPPFDVIIVADHSASLSWSRDDLAAGLSNLLADVQGRTARFFVLTPTQYGASSEQAIDLFTGFDLVLWSDAATGAAFTPAMTEYSLTCTDPDGAPMTCPPFENTLPVDYSAEGVWSFVAPQPVAAITADMTSAEIQAQQQAISDAILSLGGTGSPSEQPLCTLNRYLKQAPDALPEHAVFVVISDEDDATLPEDCAASYHFSLASTPTPYGESCTADCDLYRYLVSETVLVQALQFTCVPVDDLGMEHPENGVPMNTWLNGSLGADCTAVSPAGACGSGGMAWATDACGPGHVVDPCVSTCQEGPNAGCVLETTDGTTDWCNTAFTKDGQSYPSMIDYCNATVGARDWVGCTRDGFLSGVSRGGTSHVDPLVPGTTTDALITSARQLADTAFGTAGYSVEVIGFDPSFSCMLEQGQSNATNLRMLATTPEDVFPICGDYAPALDRVRQFASHLLDTEHELTLRPLESIDVVRVLQADGAERALDPADYSYDRAAGLLRVMPGVLRPSDVSLSVEVANPCGNHVE